MKSINKTDIFLIKNLFYFTDFYTCSVVLKKKEYICINVIAYFYLALFSSKVLYLMLLLML